MTVLRVDTISGIGSDGPVFDGDLEFNSQNFFVLPKGTTTEQFPNFATNAVDAASARGLFGGGYTPTLSNTIDFITISTLGDAQDFGDLTQARLGPGAVSSSIRGLWCGGYVSPAAVNTIDYVTIATTGDAQDFGDLLSSRSALSNNNCSNSTRGVLGGGGGAVNVLEYVTISTLSNSVDFGDLITGRVYLASCSSPTRGLFGGGEPSGGAASGVNSIEFVTIASTGNAQDFGDLSVSRREPGSCSSSTRGLFIGGLNPTYQTVIDFVTLQSQGNAQDFGDLTQARSDAGSCSSTIRGVFMGGLTPTKVNTIDYVTIATTSNAIDFGDTSETRALGSACSNGHGGLG